MSQRKTGWHTLASNRLATSKWAQFDKRHIQHDIGVEIPDFYTYSILDFVQVVGIKPNGGLVMVMEDRKTGGWSIEAIAGDIERGETPIQAATREFNEETVYNAGRIVYLGPIVVDTNRGYSLTNPGACWTGHLCVACELTAGPHQREASEVIETVEISFQRALHSILSDDKAIPPFGLPILQNGTQNIIQRIALREDLRQLVVKS